MTYRLTEAYGQEETITFDGRTYPVPCLVEDSDGLRWFVTSSFLFILPGHWARAAAGGAVGLMAPYEPGWAVITTEGFAEHRHEANGVYSLGQGWSVFSQPPAYRDLLAGPQQPAQAPQAGFVHLHTHSEYSALDGRSKISEIVAQAVADQQPGVGLTDHGGVPGHPELQRECEKAGIKPVFGMEAYFVHNRLRRPVKRWVIKDTDTVVPEATVMAMSPKQRAAEKLVQVSDAKEIKDAYHHLVLLAQNQVGLRNLWAMSTEAFRDGFYYYPKMDWDTLARHAEGVIATSACLRGPLSVPLLAGDEDLARSNLGRLLDIFGERFYLELHANSLPEQAKINEALVRLGQEYSVPTLAVVDAHYPTKQARPEHAAWIAVQTDSDLQDESDLFSHDIGLYMQTEAEVRANLDYLPAPVVDEAIANTVAIAESADAKIDSRTVIPVFSRRQQGETVEQLRERDADRLIDLCLSNWHLTVGPNKPPQEAYIARFEHEMPMIIRKGFPGYYLQVSDYVRAMKERKVLVGPGRGSGGGSLVAYLARITGIDPVEADLAFERFMTEGRTALPDFDVDFPASKRPVVQDYITERYGEEHVVRIGTHIRAKNKGIIKDLFRAFKSSLPETAWRDQEAIAAIIDAAEAGTAGLGLSWEELWAQEGELLEEYAKAYPQVFSTAEKLVGLLKSYGKHPAGLVVAEESLVDSLPLRGGEDEGQMITQFAMGDLEAMGFIKFDILTLRTLDTIQECVDLIEQRRGIRIDFDSWKDEYFDPQVWDTISEGHTLGVFQVETPGGIRMCKQVRPQSMAEFADVLTLVRPGPVRSGLTKLYLERRAGNSPVTVPDPRLEQVLAPTYGCILYQEQVMQACMLLAGYDSTKADEVRKILGKKQVEKVQAAGREFVEGCVKHGMVREAAEHLWEQMAEFAKYSFGKAHAYGYAVLAYWTAWLKVHYPIECFTALLSTVKQDRIPEFISEARRIGFQIAPPDINESGRGFTAMNLGVRYGLDSLKGVGEAALKTILPGQPYTSFEDFRERSGADAGITRTLARIGAFDSLGVNRRGLETLLEAEKTGDSTRCQFKIDPIQVPNAIGMIHGLPCVFDWDNEPAPVNPRTGKTLKKKAPPKKCTKACRQYLAPEPLDPAKVEPYTEEDIRDIEMEVLGIHLSSTVFDRIPEEDRDLLIRQAEALDNGPEGSYFVAATLSKVREHTDRNGHKMAFLGVVTERSDLDVTVFSKAYEKYKPNLKVGKLVYLDIYKNSRGYTLESLAVIP